jgi:hypothetical protein
LAADNPTNALRKLHLEHDPEKWKPVFRKDHAQTKRLEGMKRKAPVAGGTANIQFNRLSLKA